jgi:diguanylate cyclase (GGDEF)-like protein
MFLDRARALLALLERQNGQAAVLFIDLDRFKPINDQHGHKVGDEVLREIAARLTRSLRQSDLVARQGGDEFLVLLTASSGIVNSEVVAAKLKEAIEAPIVVEGSAHHVGASIGIAHYPEDGADLDTLIERADAAMYHVKKSGRGSHFRWTAGLS